ncbi:kinase protein [Echinococcus multilocularis]|uniref:Kinase protein n=1 Tax=Echinococcus multilocularis TaxID=6211 RepID=A0A068XUM3_ECHMU|nr:kinase protein [Echinococcus multilocularis]CUT98606.1 kinase protein [Echinococcus multilocularis]
MNTIAECKHSIREAYTLATCNHPNIVKFIGASANTRMADIRCVVIERATDASLQEGKHPPSLGAKSISPSFDIYSKVNYNIWRVMLWALQLADGYNYLHSCAEPIIHRDLKSANILLSDECSTLKISDFGSLEIFKRSKEELQSVNQGSLFYMALEVQRRKS